MAQRPSRTDSAIRHLPSTDDLERHDSRSRLVRACARLADSIAFNSAIFVVIVANAVVLGLETYDSIEGDIGGVLSLVNDLVLAIFVVELAIRLTAHEWRPRRFFASGWNVFDFAVVVASFAPGLRENATLLRLARLARVARIVRLLPDLRVLVAAIGRAIPGVLSLGVLMLVLVYVYGMIGWILFDDSLPEDYGSIGTAMLTMFVLLSVENLPVYIEEGMAAGGDATVVFFVSYVVIASFLLFNFLIGVAINSMEEARAIEAEREARDRIESGLGPVEPSALERVRELRTALDALETELRRRDSG
jgi:voltage-gated sodium channel